jgi:hypothetical protein
VDEISFSANNLTASILMISLKVNHSNWGEVAYDIPPEQKQSYVYNNYPLNSNVGCLRELQTNNLSIHLDIPYNLFIASFILYLMCAISVVIYATAQIMVHRKRLIYTELNDVHPHDMTLYQNASTNLPPGLDECVTDFSHAQKILWKHKMAIPRETFQELVDIQVKAIITEDKDYINQQREFGRLVSKAVAKSYVE